ncbi:unnamed protein product, partial [Haemonchus placei]|uniref:Skp1-related protein n=1 Tax=Haemonchus placei TaxID=6290 RepID=A0A0N4WAA8_HAEPC
CGFDAPANEASEKRDVVKIVTKDDCVFHVSRDVIHMSKTINTMISDLGVDSSDPIPICNVNGVTMKKVLDWCAYHKNDPPLADDKSKTGTSEISAWDKQFFSVDQETVFELILAANYLDISGLLDVACRVVANMINGKTPEEIRRTFNIINDFSPEEEARIRKENAWVEE